MPTRTNTRSFIDRSKPVLSLFGRRCATGPQRNNSPLRWAAGLAREVCTIGISFQAGSCHRCRRTFN